MGRQGLPGRIGRVIAAGYVALIYTFIFLPVIVLIVFSFQDGKVPVPPLHGPSLRWYEALLANDRLMDGMANSVVVASASGLVATSLGFVAAYGLARHDLRFSLLAQWILLAPLFVSYIVIGMGLLIGLNALGLPKSLWSVTASHVVINLPVAFSIIYGQMGKHQESAERAARDLGASEITVLLRITVPVLWPALFASFALTFTFSWDEFTLAYLLSNFDVTLPVELWTMLRRGLDPEANAAGTVVFAISTGVVLAALGILSLLHHQSVGGEVQP